MSAFILLGAGTFAQDLTDMLEECGHKVVGYAINVGKWTPGDRFLDRPVYDARCYPTHWPDEGFPQFPILPAIISPQRSILEMQMENLLFKAKRKFVHKSASVSPSATIEPGAVISRGVTVACQTIIQPYTIVNRAASIGHHNTIFKNATIGPGAILCGKVTVCENAVIGAGAIVLEDRIIGENASVGAGSVVTHNVEAGATVYGVPARPPEHFIGMPATDW